MRDRLLLERGAYALGNGLAYGFSRPVAAGIATGLAPQQRQPSAVRLGHERLNNSQAFGTTRAVSKI